MTPNPCYACGNLHWSKDCIYRIKKCLICKNVAHKSMHCKLKRKKKNNNFAKVTQAEDSEGLNSRKYVQVKILNKSIRLQLGSGSDLSINYVYTWKH